MKTTTSRSLGRRISAARREQADARKNAIEVAAKAVNDDEPDFREFLARWGDRYNVNNLRRLWVQYPRATCLHKYGTWQRLGRQVRRGEAAILLMQPRTGTDPDRATPDNPNGEVFFGASWMALFDFAQTDPIGEHADGTPDADPELIEEAKRLRKAAADAHPDSGGTPEAFMAAWARYEAVKDQINPPKRS